MAQLNQNRIEYIDLAKGLCITLVVFYHFFTILHDCPSLIRSLSVFRMPLYFFLSGLFFKEYEGFGGFFLRKVNKLLIPFAFFYLVTSFALPNLLYYGFSFKVSNTESLGISGLWAFITHEDFSNNPIWFLWVLFLVNIYFYTILVPVKKLTTNPRKIAAIVTILCFTIGFIGSVLLNGKRIHCAFLDSAMSALPFFAIGYLCNRFTDLLTPNRWDKFLPLFIVACFALTFYVGGKCSYRVNSYQIHPVLQYVCGMTGTLGIIFTAKMLHTLPFITYWGRYSIMILCTHGLILHVLLPLVHPLHLSAMVTALVLLPIVMFSYQLLIPFMNKYLPYVTAQKDVIKIKNTDIQ